MIGLDTNILVRLLTADDPVQTQQAALFLQHRCSAETPGFVNCVVIAELVWALQKVYGYARADVLAAMEALLSNSSLMIESRQQVQAAVLTYRSTNCDLVDALVGELNRVRGCEATATFDRKAARLKGFVQVS